MFEIKNAFNLSGKILAYLGREKDKESMINGYLRRIVLENHNIDILINRLVRIFREIGNEKQ